MADAACLHRNLLALGIGVIALSERCLSDRHIHFLIISFASFVVDVTWTCCEHTLTLALRRQTQRGVPIIVLGSMHFSFLTIPNIENTGSELSHLPAYVLVSFFSVVIVIELDGKL
jgi:hypothetical protein